MPPKVKYTKEAMTEIAYEMVRESGEECLSARNLASRLGTSTAPIFTAFSNIEEVRMAVEERARECYRHYAEAGLAMDPPFKGSGLQYIRFAKEEPMLFRMLFMRKSPKAASPTHYMPAEYEQEAEVRGTIKEKYGTDDARAKRIYNHLAVYAHGLATMYAQGQCTFTDEDVSRMLSEVFLALMKGEKI